MTAPSSPAVAGVSFVAYGAAIAAVILSSSIDAIVKYTGPQAGLLVLLAWRFFFGAIIAVFAYRLRSRQAISARTIRFHTARGVIQLLSVSAYFYSVTQLPLAVATILSFTSVLFVSPIAAIALGEKISAVAVVAAIAGFIGVAMTVCGVAGIDGAVDAVRVGGVIAAIVSGLLTAVLLVLLRVRSTHEDPYVISLFTNLVPAVILLPVVLGVAGYPARAEIMIFMVLGALGFSVWFLLSVAYAHAPAQSLAPTEYLSVAFAALYGFLFFEETVNAGMLAGGALIIGACVLAARAQTDK